ncbi:hypothetical protein YZ46_03290 [Campylobacter upsaliensis]|nr:hypothetical protein [Campylobacter upsaliensis]EDP3126366.1 hypothetical protein [Campylobacter jejuni]
MSGIDFSELNHLIQEYKGLRYFLKEHMYWTCGYVLMDLELSKKLNIHYYKNETSHPYGAITWIYNGELGDIPLRIQKENEIFFGIGDKYFNEFKYGEIPNMQRTESIVKEWIDWIVKECKELKNEAKRL